MKLRIIRKEQRLFSFSEYILLLVLLLAFMDFHLYSMHLMVVAFVLYCLFRMRIPVVRGVIPAIMMTVALTFFWQQPAFSPTAWMKRFVWPAAFLLGYGLIRSVKSGSVGQENHEKRANTLFALMAMGFLIHLLLNIYINWGLVTTNRNTLDFWSKEIRAATGQAGLACVPLAYFTAELIKKKKLKEKVLAILALAAMLYYNLTLGSRTMVAILLVQLVIVYVHSLLHRNRTKRKRNGWISIVVLVIVAWLLYQFNIWNIQELIDDSTLFRRLSDSHEEGISTNSRWANKLEYLKYMPRYLFGGSHIHAHVGAYAHDVLLDTYDEVGLLGLVAVIALLWDGAGKLILLFHCKGLHSDTKITVLCIYCTILIVFAVEPILAGMPWLLMTYCFMNGIITGLVKRER